ncbi:MAG TPA: SH3 domain-containing protein [Longimicrobium sp.]|nr:SH3 domain-containing protein [Longimicrobium sp.]
MLICDRCHTSVPDGARFCAACGDPVTAADRPESRAIREVERVQLVCPGCDQQSLFDIPAHGVAQETCPRCRAVFATRVVRIKSKRSAGNKTANTRRFTVRVEDLNGREDLIEFDRPSNDDFELRSRDLAAFSSKDGRLLVVQNLTLGRYMRLGSASGCGAAVVLMGLAVLFLGFCGVILDNDPSPPSPGSSTSGSLHGAGPTSSPSRGVIQEADTADWLYIHGTLNVRKAPDRSAALVRTLSRGEVVRLGRKDENGWAPIYSPSGDREGYVYRASDLVRSTAPRTRPAEAAPSGTRPSGGASASTGSRRRSGGSSGYYTGPRGGCYTYSASGRKRYVDRSYCY